LQVDIRAANFRDFDFEECGIRFEIGLDNFTNFDRRVWVRDNGDEWHAGRIYCITTSR
jgi:hypothetical protein